MKRAPRYIYTYILPGGLSVCVCLPSFHRCVVAESFACCLAANFFFYSSSGFWVLRKCSWKEGPVSTGEEMKKGMPALYGCLVVMTHGVFFRKKKCSVTSRKKNSSFRVFRYIFREVLKFCSGLLSIISSPRSKMIIFWGEVRRDRAVSPRNSFHLSTS